VIGTITVLMAVFQVSDTSQSLFCPDEKPPRMRTLSIRKSKIKARSLEQHRDSTDRR